MSDNKLVILGSASGVPQASRSSSGYLLKTGETLSLLDCGSGVTSSFLRRGYDPLRVDRIFISHTHPDHVTDLPLFIQLVYLKGRTGPLEVYLPPDFVRPFRSYLLSLYIVEEKLPFELNICGYEPGQLCENPVKLTAVANNHLEGYRELIEKLDLPNKMQCCSFDMVVDGKKLFYSADIATYDDVRSLLDGHDVVILESTHIDLNQFFEHAPTISVGKFVISHLGTDDEIQVLNEMAAKAGMDNLVTAVDGMEIQV